MARLSLTALLGPPHRRVELSRGGAAFHRGDPATAVFEVRAGRIRLERAPADGSALVVGVLGPGEGLAEASVFADAYHCDAIAEVASRLAAWERDAVLERLASDPDLARRWLRHTSRQVRHLRAVLELRGVSPVTERVLAWLRLRDDGFLPAGDGDEPLRALADRLGVRPEVLYRALASLEEEGRLRRDGRRLELAATGRDTDPATDSGKS